MIAWREWLAFANEGGIYSQSIGIECTVCTALSPFFVITDQIFRKWPDLTTNLRSQLHNRLDHRLRKIRKIVGLATRYKVPIDHNRCVDPDRSCVLQIVFDA